MIARIRDVDGRIVVIAGAIAGVRTAIDMAESRGAKVIDVRFDEAQGVQRDAVEVLNRWQYDRRDLEQDDESPLEGLAEKTPAGSGNDFCATQGR